MDRGLRGGGQGEEKQEEQGDGADHGAEHGGERCAIIPAGASPKGDGAHVYRAASRSSTEIVARARLIV
jgi:hypothetical protein